jgi:hypothetical protein
MNEPRQLERNSRSLVLSALFAGLIAYIIRPRQA